MNPNTEKPVIIKEEDYQRLKAYIFNEPGREDEMTLSNELRRAEIVSKAAFPPDTIGLNSKVTILDTETGKTREIILVLPDNANIQNNMISILTPIGAALIGFRKGEEVVWKVPAGLKRFRIVNVLNE